MRVYVTAKDLVEGVRGDCSKCAVARPLKRMFPECHVSVNADSIELYPPDDRDGDYPYLSIDNQDWLMDRILEWDTEWPGSFSEIVRESDIEPFYFDLPNPGPNLL